MLSLEEVVALPGLRLRIVDGTIGDGRGARDVRWAHVSELPDPTPWLLGHELLLSTGLGLFGDDAGTREYCRRLVKAGVTALGVSTGSSLPHRELPAALVAACTDADLPLVHVPEGTGLQAIIHAVSDALTAEQTEPMRRALLAQQNLGEAATQPDGPAAVLARTAETSGMHSVLLDVELKVVAEWGAEALDLGEIRSRVRARMIETTPWSIGTDMGAWTVSIVPVRASGEVRGILVLAKEGVWSEYDRALRSMAQSLLSVLLELRHTSGYRRRVDRAHALDAVLDAGRDPRDVRARLVRADLDHVRRTQVLVLPDPEAGRRAALLAGLHDLAADVLTRESGGALHVVLADPVPAPEPAVAELVGDCGVVGVGMSRPVALTDAHVALRQAERAHQIARSRKVGFVALEQLGGYRALLSLGAEADRQGFADQVLGMLTTPEARSAGLYEALRAYVRSAGSLEGASAQLGVHRHTVRARLRRVAEVTGLDPARSADLFELWLAVEIRELFVVDDEATGA